MVQNKEEKRLVLISIYQLIPRGAGDSLKYSGEQLLDHMCGYRNRMFAKDQSIDDDDAFNPRPRQQPSQYLDVHLYGDNLRAIMPTPEDFNRGNVMSHTHGTRAQRKMANIGTVMGHCG